jgi:hypothetical protein
MNVGEQVFDTLPVPENKTANVQTVFAYVSQRS